MLKVFISHSHEEKDIAIAWQELLEHISQGAIEVWLSSDTKVSGGMRIGAEWRENIYDRLTESDFVIAVLSPRSIERPWILWETGVASGTNKERGLIPVIYSMPLSDFSGPLASYQAYSGEDEIKIIEICERLMTEAHLKPRPEYWGPIIENYIGVVKLHRPPRRAGASAINVWLRRIESYVNTGRSYELPSIVDSMYSSLGSRNSIDEQIHELLSKVFLEDRNFDYALTEVEKALNLLPDDLGLLHRKTLVLLETKQYQRAKESIDMIHREFPEAKYLPEVAGLEGRLYRQLYECTGEKDNLEQSIIAYETAYQKNRYSYYCGVNAVVLKYINGSVSESKILCEDVLSVCTEIQKHGKDSFWLDFTIGELKLILGDVEEAIIAYKSGLSREPKPKARHLESAFTAIQRVFDYTELNKENLVRFKELFGE